MSIFNYKSKRDPLESLANRVAKIEKIFRLLKFWEVNDTVLGANVLKRRKITPSITIGTVGKGEWHDVTGFGNTLASANKFDWTKCAFGYKVNPDGNDKDEVRIYIGNINGNASTQTDLAIAGTVETSVTKYVYARVVIATPSTILVTQADSVPADDATYNYYRLYRFTSNLVTGSSPAKYIIDDDSTMIYRPFDIDAGGEDELPASATTNQVLTWNGTAWVADWVRWA